VTVVEGSAAGDPALASHVAWSALPVVHRVEAVSLIVREAGRWRAAARFLLEA